jgi:hypothetical protein
MKKSKVLFISLLASLGLISVSATNLPSVQHLNLGIVAAKADVVNSAITNSVITNRNGDMKPLITTINDTPDRVVEYQNYLSSQGERSVNARENTTLVSLDLYPIADVSKNVTNYVWNIPIENKTDKDIYIRDFCWLPNTTDGNTNAPQSANGPIFKIGMGPNSTYKDTLTPPKIGLTSDVWSGDDNPKDQDAPTVEGGLNYRNAKGAYVSSKNAVPNLTDVTGIAFFGTIKAHGELKIQIPLYISNPDAIKNGVRNNFYNILYQYKDGYVTPTPDSAINGSYLFVGAFDSNIKASEGTMTVGNTPTVSLFDVKDPSPANVKISKVIDPNGNDVTGKVLNTVGDYKVTLSAPGYGDVTVDLTVTANGSTGGSTGGATIPAATLTPATNVSSSSSSSSSQGSSSTTTKPSISIGPNIAVKGEAVYGVKKIGLYKSTSFTKRNRIAWYPKQKRVNRPMFVVTGYKRTSNGTLRYKVRDVNHGRKTAGKTGYITASRKYVVPVYYAGVPKSKKITVISKKGIHAYKSANLTGKAKHYKKGVHLTVKKLVKHNLTSRYQLSNGNFITTNKKLIIAGKY